MIMNKDELYISLNDIQKSIDDLISYNEYVENELYNSFKINDKIVQEERYTNFVNDIYNIKQELINDIINNIYDNS